jgi:hypothetical protein
MKYIISITALISAIAVGYYLGKQFAHGEIEKVVIIKKELRMIVQNRSEERVVADTKIKEVAEKYKEKVDKIQSFDITEIVEEIPESKIVDSMVCFPESTAKEYLVLRETVKSDSAIIQILKDDRDSADSKLNQYVSKTDTLIESLENGRKDAINSSYKKGILHGIYITGAAILTFGVVRWF